MREKLCIVFLLDRLNEWFMDMWLEHYKKYNAHIVCLVESCSKEVYEKLLNSKVEVHFWGNYWGGANTRNHIIDIVRKKYNPEWIMLTHADEIFEDKMFSEIDNLMGDPTNVWYRFPIYHFWECFTHYRNDGAWKGGMMDVMRLWKNNVLPRYVFGGKGQVHHVQSAPNDIGNFPGKRLDIRVKHFSNANKGAWQAKCFVRGKNWAIYNEPKELELVEWKE